MHACGAHINFPGTLGLLALKTYIFFIQINPISRVNNSGITSFIDRASIMSSFIRTTCYSPETNSNIRNACGTPHHFSQISQGTPNMIRCTQKPPYINQDQKRRMLTTILVFPIICHCCNTFSHVITKIDQHRANLLPIQVKLRLGAQC